MPRVLPRLPWPQLVFALAFYSLTQLVFLGLPQISGSSEAREAQVIDTIVREGNWVLPLRNGVIPSKPPLFHWVGASISNLIGGVSELSVRLPSHLAALGILLLVTLCAHRVAGKCRTIEGTLFCTRVSLLTPAILSLTYGFHQLASQAMVDMIFSFFFWCAISSLVLTDDGANGAEDRLPWINRFAFWSACAGAVVARGPIGLILPLAVSLVTGAYLVGVKRVSKELFRPSVGWLAFTLPVAWYYGAWRAGGEAFLARQLIFENLQRFTGSPHMNNESWWFYLPSLFRTTFPWGVISLVGLASYLRRSRSLSFLGGFKPWVIAPSVALAVGVSLFSMASGKRHSYMLPLEPLVAIQAALLLSIFAERQSSTFLKRLAATYRPVEGVLILALTLVLLAFGLAYEIDWNLHPLEDLIKFSCKELTLRASTVALLSLLVVSVVRNRSQRNGAQIWLLLMLLLTITVATGNVIKGALKGFPLLAEQLLLVAGANTKIAVIKDPFDEYFDPIFFYLRRPVSILDLTKDLGPCDPSTVYVIRRTLLSQIRGPLLKDITRLTTLQEVKLALEGRSGLELEVFVCKHQTRAEPPLHTGPLRDAKVDRDRPFIG
jgi:4-amino-4-deoxy-L-arabinose transferase-like glycosyltransferase